MRVLLVTAVFPPEALTTAQTSSDVAEEMARRGHDVTVVTSFPNRPAGVVMPGYRRRLRHVEHRDGYRIVRTWHTLSKKSSLPSRTAENITFGITSTLALVREIRPDVVFLATWPIFAQWLNSLLLRCRRVPVVCAVKDVYPEALPGRGIFGKLDPIRWSARSIDRQVLRRSRTVTCLSSAMAEYLMATRNLSPDKVHVVPDWVDASRFSGAAASTAHFREKLGLPPDAFLAMYVGSITGAAGPDLYVKAAATLRHRKDIHLVLVGDGAIRKSVEGAIQDAGLTNIRVVYPLHTDDVPEVLAAANVLLLSLLPGTAEHSTPSKLIFYLFSGRAILASVHPSSSAARILQEAGCGSPVEQADPEALAARLEEMADDRSSLDQLGKNGLKYAEQHFLKSSVMPRLCDLLESAARA
jgi:glycosyltransferase involved in cell wall biosynthesis